MFHNFPIMPSLHNFWTKTGESKLNSIFVSWLPLKISHNSISQKFARDWQVPSMTPLLDHCVHLPEAQDDMFIIAQPQKMVCHCLLCLVSERHLTPYLLLSSATGGCEHHHSSTHQLHFRRTFICNQFGIMISKKAISSCEVFILTGGNPAFFISPSTFLCNNSLGQNSKDVHDLMWRKHLFSIFITKTVGFSAEKNFT